MGVNSVIDLTNSMLDLNCEDCRENLSDGGNNVTRAQAMRRLRSHFNKTGHTRFSVVAIGEVTIPDRWKDA